MAFIQYKIQTSFLTALLLFPIHEQFTWWGISYHFFRHLFLLQVNGKILIGLNNEESRLIWRFPSIPIIFAAGFHMSVNLKQLTGVI